MHPIHRIVFPIDFSERSRGAAKYARTLACYFHADLLLLHILSAGHVQAGGIEMTPALLEDWHDILYKERKAQLDQFAIDEFDGAPTQGVILTTDPASGIVKYAHAENASLIVMPTHGYGPFRRFLLGSVTAKVLHDADCPVFTGTHMEHPPAQEEGLFRNILCATDLGPQSEKIVSWTTSVAEQLKAQLSIVHAVPFVCADSAALDPLSVAALSNEPKERITKLQDKVGRRAAVIIEYGDPVKVIGGIARARRADLVVIGRHESAGVRGRLREQAYAIIRESPCPVVSV
jgi:nucleotide-binding universal stress UspA family protein